MKMQLFKAILSAVSSAIVFGAVAFSASSAIAASSSASSHVGITKLESLRVSSMENSELFLSNSIKQMQSETCLQSAGDDMPYRISASSLSGKNQFAVKSNDGVIPYQVSWSNENDNHSAWILDSVNDQTGVLSATSTGSCVMNIMSVQLDSRAFKNADEGTYTDTLSLMLVIE